jgi:hypothetical protein
MAKVGLNRVLAALHSRSYPRILPKRGHLDVVAASLRADFDQPGAVWPLSVKIV